MIGVNWSIAALLQGVLILAIAPGLLGLLRWVKARAQDRHRRPITLLQPYRDLRRLARQPAVRSNQTTLVFAAAPVIVWTCYGTLAFALPLLGQPPLLQIDLITLVYLLALARLALALAGLDAGAPFGALGSARVMFLSVPTDLALVLIGAALALHWHTLSLWGLLQGQWHLGTAYLLQADLLLVALALWLTLALEAGRIPIDNPATHQELTMSQKAILLDYAGRDLALIEWAEAIKLAVLLGFFALFFVVPLSLAPATYIRGFWLQFWLGLCSLAALLLTVIIVAHTEVGRPKVRLRKTSHRAVVAAGLSLAAVLYRVITETLK